MHSVLLPARALIVLPGSLLTSPVSGAWPGPAKYRSSDFCVAASATLVLRKSIFLK